MNVEQAKAWLTEMDELRYSEPDQVIAELVEKLKEIPRTLVPEMLGVWGSAYRIKYEHDTAQRYIEEGIAYAHQAGDHMTAGSNHQRLSMVHLYRPNYDAAYTENCKAIACHKDGENPIGVAKATVDRGVILCALGFLDWSTACLKRALRSLPENEKSNRATALHLIAHNLLEKGKSAEALPFFAEVEKMQVDPQNAAKQAWQYGRALSNVEQHEAAIEKIVQAVEQLNALSPPEAALAYIDLCKAYIRAGQPTRAHRAAFKILRFTEPFGKHPVAKAAIIELANVGARGEGLTLALLDQARTKVKGDVQAS